MGGSGENFWCVDMGGCSPFNLNSTGDCNRCNEVVGPNTVDLYLYVQAHT